MRTKPLLLLALTPALVAGPCSRSSERDTATGASRGFTLAAPVVDQDLFELTKFPHPFGSPRQAAIGALLARRVEGMGFSVNVAPFTATVPNPAALTAAGPVATTLERQGANIYAFAITKPAPPCLVLFASHYDTKDLGDAAYLGANDSGSSTVALLQILRHLKQNDVYKSLRCGFGVAFFDGEEALLSNWNDGERAHPARQVDNTYGSRELAKALVPCAFDGKPAQCLPPKLVGGEKPGIPLTALILLDMIGSPDLRLTRDANSSPRLRRLAEESAASLGHPELYAGEVQAIEDDHTPFASRGIESLDLIDFTHLAYWHQHGDEAKTLAKASIELATRLALCVGSEAARSPLAP